VTTSVHGYVRYHQGCRCFTCRIGKSRYEQQLRDGERPGIVDAGPARRHVAALRAAGFGTRRLVAATGVSRSTLQRLETQPTVFAVTAERLLAYHGQPVPSPQRFIPATGTHRRMQALCALGWSPRSQIQMAGLAQAGSTRLLAVNQVWPRTAEKVRVLYEQLAMTVPPPGRHATKARHRAVRERVFPPLAWDDDLLDDPAALPCLLPPVEPVGRDVELAVQHRAAGHAVDVTSQVRRELIRRTPERPIADVAELAQCTRQYVSSLRKQLEREPAC